MAEQFATTAYSDRNPTNYIGQRIPKREKIKQNRDKMSKNLNYIQHQKEKLRDHCYASTTI